MGSCCVSAGSGGAYIVTHFRGDYASLFELAHEVGHACHAALAADQGRYYSEPSQLCGEIAALFAELMVLDEVKREQIKRGAEDPEIAALLHWEVDHFFRNYFGQLRLTRFELHLYQRRAGGERLNSSWLDQAWRSETELLYGGEVPLETLLLGSEWLVFQRHLSEGRLYSWTYPWALSAAVALRARLLQGKLIESDYLAFLAAGSARPTQELLGSLALDSGPRLQEEAVAIFQERLGELEHLEQRDGDIAHQA
jgi:oligoendopeptidase F